MHPVNPSTSAFILNLIKRRQVRTPRNTLVTAILLPPICAKSNALRFCSLTEHAYPQGTQVQQLYITVLVIDLSVIPGLSDHRLIVPAAVQKQFGIQTEMSAWCNDNEYLNIDSSLQSDHCLFIEEQIARLIQEDLFT